MAEAFARTYGSDVLAPASAGVNPAGFIAEEVVEVLTERGVSLGSQFSKSIFELRDVPYDIVVNMAGEPIPKALGRELRTWPIPDPMGGKPEVFQSAAERIESLVMNLILELRAGRRKPA
jgi:protein-tyrosine-phosphatase